MSISAWHENAFKIFSPQALVVSSQLFLLTSFFVLKESMLESTYAMTKKKMQWVLWVDIVMKDKTRFTASECSFIIDFL